MPPTLPVVASTAASRTRRRPETVAKVPPTNRVLPAWASASTAAFGRGPKVATAAPVAGSSMARRSHWEQPRTLLNTPPAYRWVPSALTSSALTALSGCGSKAVTSWPLAASMATRFDRAIDGVPLPTAVKLPPT